MAEASRGFALPKYGVLESVRHQAKSTNDLINLVCARLGDSIAWHRQDGYCNYIERRAKATLFFKLHGNQFANSVEFFSSDIEVLRLIKQAFPKDFSADVQIKEGLC